MEKSILMPLRGALLTIMPYSGKLLIIALILGLSLISTLSSAGELEVMTRLHEEKGLLRDDVYSALPEEGWGLFIASGGGLQVFLEYAFLPIFQGMGAIEMAKDPKGILWVRTNRGIIYRVSSADGIWTAEPFDAPVGKEITALAARHDTLYVGTAMGLYYIDDISSGPEGYKVIIADSHITSLLALGDGTLLAGVKDLLPEKTGLKIIGGEISGNRRWVGDLSSMMITTLWTDSNLIIVGTESSGAYVLSSGDIRKLYFSTGDDRIGFEEIEREKKKQGRINTILYDEGILYVATDDGLFVGDLNIVSLTLLEDDDGPVKSKVTTISPGPGLAVWMGTGDDGLFLVRYHGDDK